MLKIDRRLAPGEVARSGHRAKDHEGRSSLYDEVTRAIIAQLEAGRIPWAQPWGSPQGCGAGPCLPRNALTGRAYSGVNILLLWGGVIEKAYPSQFWLTFRQAIAAGGSVRKGEHGVTIVYADRFIPRAENERAACDREDPKPIPFLKRFTVFNVAQCENLPGPIVGDPPPLDPAAIVPVAERLITASGADFRIGGDKAFYAPGPDCICVPPQSSFHAPINYYRTALHELTHWTGHKTRLARDFSGGLGSAAYAREELVAEMGAAFLCAALGIVPTVRHADYLGSWLAVLRTDNRAIFRAASQASKACDYLLGIVEETQSGALMPERRAA